MTTSVSFESATVADAIKKAASVAPAKVGSAFDKAAGVIFDIDPNASAPCVVRATDTEVFYIETVDVDSAHGDAVRWRFPSQLLSGVLSATSGKLVHFRQDNNPQVEVSSGRMKARINLNANPHYPEWDPSDKVKMVTAPNFGASLARVEWAASKAGPPPLNGIRIDGQYITSTDRYRIARVPCEVPLEGDAITIPAWSITGLLKPMGDVQIGVDGNFLIVMPDDYTQIKTVCFGTEFPRIEKVMSLAYEQEVRFHKTDLIEKIQKATPFAGADRAPKITLFLGKQEIAVMLRGEETGLFGDVIEIPGQAEHDRVQIFFSPKMLLDPLMNTQSDKVTLKYNPADTNLPVCICGDSGYEVWVAPRSEKTPGD